MKKLVFILGCIFILGCEGEPDSSPIRQTVKCNFKNFKLGKELKFTFDCLERKKKDTGFSLYLFSESYTSEDYSSNNGKEDNSIIIPKEVLAKCGKNFTCNIGLYPYFPTSFDKQQQDEYIGTKLTYIMRIYKDEQLIYEKELKYPKEDYPTIHIDL
ncbi:MAG: hypothetical protein KGV44_14060 [Flavobacteriaceae bacterium]|nr:hypothetical protein [Flavobacteriaceae bacterium]